MNFRGLALSSLLLASCGTNTPHVPLELLGDSDSGACASPQYPDGPFGAEEGDTLANFCFRGFRSPAKTGHDESSLETVAFSDYYDPTGSKGFSLLLINTAAVWCSACRTEHETLSAENDAHAPKGLRIVSTLFQDAAGDPATLHDLGTWVDTFSSDYPMVLDPGYQMGAYASPSTAPLNLVVDARTMKIEKKLLGDPATILWPFIDAALAPP